MFNYELQPVTFPEANKNLLKPESLTDDECKSLWVYTDEIECISCWKLTFRQRLSLLFHGRIWLSVFSGNGTQPPVWLGCCKTIFKHPEE